MTKKITSRKMQNKNTPSFASGAAFRRTEGRFLAEGAQAVPELARGGRAGDPVCTENAEKVLGACQFAGEHHLV